MRKVEHAAKTASKLGYEDRFFAVCHGQPRRLSGRCAGRVMGGRGAATRRRSAPRHGVCSVAGQPARGPYRQRALLLTYAGTTEATAITIAITSTGRTGA